jgi:hypothetical protein
MERLRLVLEPSQAEYGVDEELPVRVLLVNAGDDPVTVDGRLAVSSPSGPGELAFSVIDPSGERLPFGARVNLGRPGAGDVATIAPGDSVDATIDLVDYFDLSEPGTYRVSATYRAAGDFDEGDDEDGGAFVEVWTGTLESDEVSIDLR